MTVKPINTSLKHHFETLMRKANEKASLMFQINYEEKAISLDALNQFLLLSFESERIDKIIENSDYPFYIKNHSSEDWLLTQFSSRAFLLNIDESDSFIDAVSFGKYRSFISKAKDPLRDTVPQYSFEKFINDEYCAFFSNFNTYYRLSEEDYYKIKEWQTTALIKLVGYEYRMLIKKIQAHCIVINNPLEFIISEKEKIENRLKKAKENGKVLKEILSDLFIFKFGNSNNYDEDLLIKNYRNYKSEVMVWKYITPKIITPLLYKVDSKIKEIISTEQTIFYTINKIADWFELVIKGLPIQTEILEPKWDILLTGELEKADTKILLLTDIIEEFAYNPENSEAEIKDYLIEQLEEYRGKFNSCEKKYLFHIHQDDKKYLLSRMFISNAFFNNDVQGELDGISESFIIQEISWLIAQIYKDIFNTHQIDYPHKDEAYFDIMFLLHQMVLDKELYESLQNSLYDFFRHFENYFLPIDIHFQNQRDTMSKLFHKAIDRLQSIFDDAETSNKILFLQSRLKELRQRELQIKGFQPRKKHTLYDHKYSKFFKEFLEIEAEFIKETRELNSIPLFIENKPVLQLDSTNTLSVQKLFTIEKETYLLQMLENLCITSNGKSILSIRKKGAIRGIVEALLENNLVPHLSIELLCNFIAEKIGLDLKSKLDESHISKDFYKKATSYIKNNNPNQL